MRSYVRPLHVLPLLACLIGSAALAQAQSDASSSDGAIAYRRDVMRALGGHTGAMALILEGEGGEAQDLQIHVDAVVALAPLMPKLFPEGSDVGRTDALPEIWLEPGRFRQRLADFQRSVDELGPSARGERRQFAEALQSLAASCKGCHDRYMRQ